MKKKIQCYLNFGRSNTLWNNLLDLQLNTTVEIDMQFQLEILFRLLLYNAELYLHLYPFVILYGSALKALNFTINVIVTDPSLSTNQKATHNVIDYTNVLSTSKNMYLASIKRKTCHK